MDAPVSAAEFWGSADVVDDFLELNDRPLRYEEALIELATVRAASTAGADESGTTEGLQRVHVIGVGGGRELTAVRAAAPSAFVHAWDISAPMVRACRAFVADRAMERIDVAQADVAELVPTDGPADLVVAVNAVCSYFTTPAQRRRSAAAIASLLRPGGAIAVVVQQRNGRPDWAVWFPLRSIASRLRLAPGLPGDRRNRHDGTTLLVHHYTSRELRSMFERAGFIDVRIESLRRWGRSAGHHVPRRSPNPLLMTAVLALRPDPPPS